MRKKARPSRALILDDLLMDPPERGVESPRSKCEPVDFEIASATEESVLRGGKAFRRREGAFRVHPRDLHSRLRGGPIRFQIQLYNNSDTPSQKFAKIMPATTSPSGISSSKTRNFTIGKSLESRKMPQRSQLVACQDPSMSF